MSRIDRRIQEVIRNLRQNMISVIIIAYKRRQYIESCILSAATQKLPREKYEIIVVKDYVDAKIDKLIEETGSKSILVDEKLYGIKLAQAIGIARGEIICCLDDDDLFTYDKLHVIDSLFTNDERLVFVHNGHRTLSSNIHAKKALHNSSKLRIYYDTEKHSKYRLNKLIRSNPHFNSSSISFRKKIFNRELFINYELMGGYDTILFILALSSEGVILNIPDILTVYRVHDSTSMIVSQLSHFFCFKLRWFQNYKNSLLITKVAISSATKISINFTECLLKESLAHLLILSNENLRRLSALKMIKELINCHCYIPNLKLFYLLAIVVLYGISPNFSRTLYYINYKKNI